MKELLYLSNQSGLPKTLEEVAATRKITIRTAAYPAFAQALAGNQPPDLILFDCEDNLAEVIEACQTLRNHKHNSRIPVIVLLAQEDASRRAEVIEAGAYEYLFKPLEAIELKIKLDTFSRIKDSYDKLEKKNLKLKVMGNHLKELLKLKNDLVYIASHDLKVPITNIVSFGRLLTNGRLGPLTDKQKSSLNTIMKNSDTMLKLIDSLLNFFEIQDEITVHKQSFNAFEVLRNLHNLYLPWSADKRQEFVLNVPTDLPALYSDKLRFVQIIEHILQNAFKYTPKGGRVELGAFEDREKKGLVVYVRDNGIGIQPENMKTIFQRFSKNHSYGTDGEFGLGLGLSVSERILRTLGGKISVTSKPNEETTFYLKFKGKNK